MTKFNYILCVSKCNGADDKSNYQILSFIRETPDKIERTVEKQRKIKRKPAGFQAASYCFSCVKSDKMFSKGEWGAIV